VKKVLVADLSEEEQRALQHSADVLKKSMEGLHEQG